MFLGNPHGRSLLTWKDPEVQMIPLELPCPPPPCTNSVFIQQAPFMWQKDGTWWLQACMVLLISKLDKMIVLP